VNTRRVNVNLKGTTIANTKAILITISTYGTWLRGDARGWVEDGIVFPENSPLQAWDREADEALAVFPPARRMARYRTGDRKIFD